MASAARWAQSYLGRCQARPPTGKVHASGRSATDFGQGATASPSRAAPVARRPWPEAASPSLRGRGAPLLEGALAPAAPVATAPLWAPTPAKSPRAASPASPAPRLGRQGPRRPLVRRGARPAASRLGVRHRGRGRQLPRRGAPAIGPAGGVASHTSGRCPGRPSPLFSVSAAGSCPAGGTPDRRVRPPTYQTRPHGLPAIASRHGPRQRPRCRGPPCAWAPCARPRTPRPHPPRPLRAPLSHRPRPRASPQRRASYFGMRARPALRLRISCRRGGVPAARGSGPARRRRTTWSPPRRPNHKPFERRRTPCQRPPAAPASCASPR